MDFGQERVILHGRGNMIALLVVALVFVALGLALLYIPELQSQWEAQVLGLVTVAFFGAAAAFFLARAVSPRPALILRHDGFVDNASLVSAGLVPWNEVEAVYVSTVRTHGHGQKFLCVVPRNLELLLAQQNPVKRLVMRQNMQMVGAPVTIPLLGLTISGEDLVAEFRARVPEKFRDVN